MVTVDRAVLCLRLLGGVEVIAAEGQDITPAGKKLRALIACLALAPKGGWPRERLTALLWGDRDEEQARASLRQALAELRRSFGDPCPIHTDRERAGLRSDLISVDALEFARRAESGDAEAAAKLYSGPLLDGVSLPDEAFNEWLFAERNRLHHQAIDVLAKLVASQTGKSALMTAQRLDQLDPLREETQRTLMRLYVEAGQRAQALRQFEICRERLQRQLGIEPESETKQLYRAIQNSSADAGDDAPADAPKGIPAGPSTSAGEATQAVAPGTPLRQSPARTWWLALSFVLIILPVLGMAAFWQFSPKTRSGITKPSIAVLPFENLSADPEQGYLADGFTQELITEFARNGELTVIAQHTSAKFRSKDGKAGDITRELGVRYVLEGSLRRTGDTLRLTARLLDGASGRHMWAERYDIRATDIVATQDQIVRRVAGSFFAKLRDTEETGTLRHPPESLDVYELTLRGAALKHQFTADGFRAGRAALQRAIELEKDYAPAYAFLGYLDTIDAVSNFTGEKRFADLDAAIALLRTAIRLDPSMAYAYQGMSFALAMQRDPLAALEYAKKAVSLGPSDADNLLFLGRELASNGRYMEAISAGEQAFLLNPVPPVYYYANHARSLHGAGKYEEAAKLTDMCVQRNSYQRSCRLVRIAALAELGRRPR
jgi:TolB-like protein/DNA-binding SARP family transcriptional activator